MSTTLWFATALVAWLGIGTALALVLGRRGFDAFSWLLVGMVLGPLAILVAWNCVRRDERLSTEIIAVPTAPGPAGVDVLVGYDGSPESAAAIAEVPRILGDHVGRLTLVTVVPFDEAPDVDDEARAALQRQALRLGLHGAGLEIVHGHPATALAAAALEGGYALLVVGTTGHGRAHGFGSVAAELARHSAVPVLFTGQRALVPERR